MGAGREHAPQCSCRRDHNADELQAVSWRSAEEMACDLHFDLHVVWRCPRHKRYKILNGGFDVF
jgi:hypothetical protein